MLRYTEFDLKTGQILTERDFGTGDLVAKQKQVEHSYLEHWLRANHLEEAELWVAEFYNGVTDADRIENEVNGRVLVFSNSGKGYFADPQTAHLIKHGDPGAGIHSIYADDRSSPHNLTAYGSLLASGGNSSTSVSQARILIIDNEHQAHGDAPILDRLGQEITSDELKSLHYKMGDGTMLVKPQIMMDLITEDEREKITLQVFNKAGVESSITTVANLEPEVEAATLEVERQLQQLTEQKVTQFRAASPDIAGMIKGTMTSSNWCERLGVDAIISQDDIKGSDGKLSEAGIKTTSSLFVNHMTDATYGWQAVGPQVKACIPEATLHEFNPAIKQQAQQLYEIAADPQKLLDYYVAKQEARAERSTDDEDAPTERLEQDWLYKVAKADQYGALQELGKINSSLERFLRSERVDNAIKGIQVESATAQPHGLLKPWEICNKDIEHGTILFYMRSPFPNVGAAAVAINNLEALRQGDQEAYGKEGVLYLPICQYGDSDNPKYKALHVSITDFDGDRNGCFRGYKANTADLTEQVRAALKSVEDQPPEIQYEAARQLFGGMIEQMQSGQDDRISPDRYPTAVAEVIKLNAPDVRPPEIYKQAKVKHSWQDEESHSAALWRAWVITANNPTGMCANIGMALQSLALETHYIDEKGKEPLLRGISNHYEKLLNKAKDGRIVIPSDEQFASHNLPSYDLTTRIADIARSNAQLTRLTNPEERRAFVEMQLEKTGKLLMDLANGPAAMNLQTAVDNLKSSVGIDMKLHQFMEKITHKKHELQASKNDPTAYTQGQVLSTNTEEPIGWAVQTANQFYRDSELPERRHIEFAELMPRNFMPDEEAEIIKIARAYNQAVKAIESTSSQANEFKNYHSVNCTTPNGREFQIHCTAKEIYDNQDFWKAAGAQENWRIQLEVDRDKFGSKNTMTASFQVRQLDDPSEFSSFKSIGRISPESVISHSLLERAKSQAIVIANPKIEIIPPQVAHKQAHKEAQREARGNAKQRRDEEISKLPELRRINYACAAWCNSDSMKVAMQYFMPELTQALQNPPKIRLQGLEMSANQTGAIPSGEYTIRVQEASYQDKKGEQVTVRAVAVIIDDEAKTLGTIYNRSIKLPIGTMAQAHISIDGNYGEMQLLQRRPELEDQFRLRAVPLNAKAESEFTPLIAEQVKISGKSVQMVFPLKLHGEVNPLPVDNCIDAMRGHGRCHTTRNFEPYSVYGFQAGDIALAYAGTKQVAFKVGEQYRITPEMINDPAYQQKWAEMEKHSTQELQSFQGKSKVWGLHMEPLGDYVNGSLQSFDLPSVSAPAYVSAEVMQRTVGERIAELVPTQTPQGNSATGQLTNAFSLLPGAGTMLTIEAEKAYRTHWAALQDQMSTEHDMPDIQTLLRQIQSDPNTALAPGTLPSLEQLLKAQDAVAAGAMQVNAGLDPPAAANSLERTDLKIISGGQTGADLGGLLAAQELGLPTGGIAPKGYRTEAGERPELKALGLVEDTSRDYVSRTTKNISDADGTVIFGNINSPGSRLTQEQALQQGKPLLVLSSTMLEQPEQAAVRLRDWVQEHNIGTLNVAGNRESKNPGIGEQVAKVIESAFRQPLQARSVADGQVESDANRSLQLDPRNGSTFSDQIVYLNSITRDFVRANGDAVFIFGDNIEQLGMGGQAAAMRGEPNTIGIPTKHRPSNQPEAFFSDADLGLVRLILEQRFSQIDAALESGKTIYIPAAGVGTGLSQLLEKAPQIYSYIQEGLRERGIEPPAAPLDARSRQAGADALPGQGQAAAAGRPEIANSIQVVTRLPDDVIDSLRQRLEQLKPELHQDPSNYAPGRSSAWIGVEWNLKDKSFQASGVWDAQLWEFCQRISPGCQMALVTYSGNEAQGKGIGLHRDDSYANFEARSLTIEANNTDAGRWQMRQTYPAMKWADQQNMNAPVHEFSVPSGTVINFNCKNPHGADPNPDRWSLNLWAVSPKFEAAYNRHIEQHGLSGGVASKLPEAPALHLPQPLVLKAAARDLLAAPIVLNASNLAEPSGQNTKSAAVQSEEQAKLQLAKPVNIYSGSPDGLGAALTNPTELSHHKGRIVDHYPVQFRGQPWPDAEAAYQHHKNSTQAGPERDALMTSIVQAKLEQHPKLTQAIERRGGSAWIESCEHTVSRSGHSNESAHWEGKGNDSGFICCLSAAYIQVQVAQRSERTAADAEDPGRQPDDRSNLTPQDTQAGGKEPLYNPSRGELLEWLALTKLVGKTEQQQQIGLLGMELKRQYQQESGLTESTAPADYRHPSVAISAQDYEQMSRAISNLKEAVQQVQIQKPSDVCER